MFKRKLNPPPPTWCVITLLWATFAVIYLATDPNPDSTGWILLGATFAFHVAGEAVAQAIARKEDNL